MTLINIIERAFQIAQAGKTASTFEVGKELEKEGYTTVRSQLAGRALRKQIQSLCELHGPPRDPAGGRRGRSPKIE